MIKRRCGKRHGSDKIKQHILLVRCAQYHHLGLLIDQRHSDARRRPVQREHMALFRRMRQCGHERRLHGGLLGDALRPYDPAMNCTNQDSQDVGRSPPSGSGGVVVFNYIFKKCRQFKQLMYLMGTFFRRSRSFNTSGAIFLFGT